MAIETIAAGVITALATKAAEKIGEKSAEHAFENRLAILEKVRNLLVGEELTMLNLLEEDPKNEFLQNKVKEKLQPKLEADPQAAAELEKLCQPFLSPTNKQNTMNITGNNNVAVQDISGSDIKINQK